MKLIRRLEKRHIFFIIIAGLIGVSIGWAQQRRVAPKAKKAVPTRLPQKKIVSTTPRQDNELSYALGLARRREYQAASIRLFNMSRNPKFISERMRIKYILGLMLYEMKMYQVAAFQFVDVIRNNDQRYLRQSLQKLSLAADILDDDTLLNYAVSKVSLDDFAKTNRDMLHFRIGEYYMRKEAIDKAIENFASVPAGSSYYSKAKYLEALAFVKKNDLDSALKSFATLAEYKQSAGVTNVDRVAGLMGMARVYYQQKKWDNAVEMYRQIPRDTQMWHDSLFEISWAHIRGAQFRSVLSQLHSLHSPYYEDFYLPESILLRGIVYLYICRYDEMEKTLSLFERIYQPVLKGLDDFLETHKDPHTYYNELERVIKNFDVLKGNTKSRKDYKMPFLVARDIMREGDFKRTYSYIQKLRNEESAIKQMPAVWLRSPIGQYSLQLLKGRLDSSTRGAGNIIVKHLLTMRNDLADNFEQYNFGKYEMLNGKKEALKKKISGKGILTAQVDESKNRDFYIQNGYEYWPFRGEYWLDEIGNYHYLGTHGCE